MKKDFVFFVCDLRLNWESHVSWRVWYRFLRDSSLVAFNLTFFTRTSYCVKELLWPRDSVTLLWIEKPLDADISSSTLFYSTTRSEDAYWMQAQNSQSDVNRDFRPHNTQAKSDFYRKTFYVFGTVIHDYTREEFSPNTHHLRDFVMCAVKNVFPWHLEGASEVVWSLFSARVPELMSGTSITHCRPWNVRKLIKHFSLRQDTSLVVYCLITCFIFIVF